MSEPTHYTPNARTRAQMAAAMRGRVPVAGLGLIRQAIERTEREIADPEGTTGITGRKRGEGDLWKLSPSMVSNQAKRRLRKLMDVLEGRA